MVSMPRPGIWSTGDLKTGAEVARVPWKLLITRATAREALDIPRDLAQDRVSLGVEGGCTRVPGVGGCIHQGAWGPEGLVTISYPTLPHHTPPS